MAIYQSGAPANCADCTNLQVQRPYRQIKTQYHCARLHEPCNTAMQRCSYIPLLKASNELFYAATQP